VLLIAHAAVAVQHVQTARAGDQHRLNLGAQADQAE
jgi:hypothetical protein